MTNDRVQSVIFDKHKITIQEAIQWLKNHGFVAKKVDETKNKFRFRQFNPSKNRRLRILHLNDVVTFVMEYPEGGYMGNGLMFGCE